MATSKTVSSHGYLTEPEWLTDQAHSTRWARTKEAALNAARILSLCLVCTLIAVLAIAVKG